MKISVKDNLCMLQNHTYDVDDASISRIFEHGHNGVMIISACTESLPLGKKPTEFTVEEHRQYKECRDRMEQLKQDIRKEGLGYIPSIGGYKENSDKAVIDVEEFSLIVPRDPTVMDEEDFVDFAMGLVRKYGQRTVLISGISIINGGKPRYLDGEKEVQSWSSEFSKLRYYPEVNTEERPNYSRIKGRPHQLVFEK